MFWESPGWKKTKRQRRRHAIPWNKKDAGREKKGPAQGKPPKRDIPKPRKESKMKGNGSYSKILLCFLDKTLHILCFGDKTGKAHFQRDRFHCYLPEIFQNFSANLLGL